MTETNKEMSTYEKLHLMNEELEKAEIAFNKMHRKAKYFKINTLQPMQREFNALKEQWRAEMRQKTGLG